MAEAVRKPRRTKTGRVPILEAMSPRVNVIVVLASAAVSAATQIKRATRPPDVGNMERLRRSPIGEKIQINLIGDVEI